MSELTEVPSQHLAATPENMLMVAVQRGASIEELEKLIGLKERLEASEAENAYHVALAAFKKNPPEVIKDKENDQYGSMYVSLPNLVNTLSAALSKHKLDARWEFSQENSDISVTCILTHVKGHSEKATLIAPPDTSGAKNTIQQIKSTTTYLKATTLEAVTGTASIDANTNDDGNSAAQVPPRRTESVRRTVQREEKMEADPAKVAEYASSMKAAVFNQDDPGIYELMCEFQSDSAMSIAISNELDSSDRTYVREAWDRQKEIQKSKDL